MKYSGQVNVAQNNIALFEAKYPMLLLFESTLLPFIVQIYTIFVIMLRKGLKQTKRGRIWPFRRKSGILTL